MSVLVSTAYAIAVGGNRNGALALGLIVGAIVTGRLARVRGVRGWVGAWLLTLAGQFVVGLILLVLVGR